MYRNAVYNSRERCIKLFTWDEEGNRVSYNVSHNPYLYVEDPKGDKTSIFGTKIKKKYFNTSYERFKFITESGIKRLYENLPPVQQYLIDTFYTKNDDKDFAKQPLKIVYLDIETYSPSSGGFPDVDNPTHPVTVITCYDSLTKVFHTFGVKPYTGTNTDIEYTHCKSERELFIKFIEFFEKDYPDVCSGYNSEIFDIPYIVNRCERILGEEYVRRLSPLGNVHFRLVKGKFGREQKRYYIDGISLIDYLDIYRRFCLKLRESYKLDAIAEIELGERKIDYGGMDLATLSDTNWNTFVDYNIQDVNLLIRLESKLQYIALLRMLAYVGLTTFEGAMGTITVINGALAITSRLRGEVISTFVRAESAGKNPGAYVSEPKSGFKENVVSFDANSLYPNVMISLNLSPETKVGRIEKTAKNTINIYHVSGKCFELSYKAFNEFINTEKCAITKAGFLFSQKKKGIIPEFLDHHYSERVKVKNQLFEIKKKLSTISKNDPSYTELQYEAERLNTKQLVIKVLVNSAYGYMGNKQAPIGDDDIASSVTLTGQAIIKQSGKMLQDYLKVNYNITDSVTLNESWVYSDTDSYTGDTKIVTDKGTFDAAALWDEFFSKSINLTTFGHEVQKVNDLNVMSYDKEKDVIKFRKVKNLIRHKVSKGKYKITVKDKDITMTEDHGCIVVRDGNLVRVSAKEIRQGDKMLVRK